MVRDDLDFDNVIPSFIHIVNRFCDKNWYVPPAVRDFHNFMLVASGEGTVITNGTEYAMAPGTLIYHYPGQSFGYTTSQTNLIHCFGMNFYLGTTLCDSGSWNISSMDKLPFKHMMKVSDMGILSKYFSDIAQIWNEDKQYSQLKLRSIFLNLLYELSSQSIKQQSHGRIKQDIEFISSYIRQYYNQQFSLKNLASLIDLNPNYFSSIFKEHTGYTLIEYINKVKIEKAEEYLGIGYTISETSSLVGFNDPFYFSKVFKKNKGVCPRDYVKAPSKYF